MKTIEPIPIRLLNGPSRAWLSLHGTILTYEERLWAREAQVDIPVELVSTSQTKKLWGLRLILALLSLLAGPAAGGATAGIITIVRGRFSEDTTAVCMLIGSLAGLASFVILLCKFFRKVPVVVLRASQHFLIEFWLQGKHARAMTELLQEIEARQATVRETIPYPLKSAIGDAIHRPWKSTIGAVFLFAIPALMTERVWLFWLCIVPLALQLHRSMASISHPRLFRLAVRSYLKKRWNVASDQVLQLIKARPDFVPAHLMHIDLLCREGRFEESAKVLSELNGVVDVETLQSMQTELVLRERIWDRKHVTAAIHADYFDEVIAALPRLSALFPQPTRHDLRLREANYRKGATFPPLYLALADHRHNPLALEAGLQVIEDRAKPARVTEVKRSIVGDDREAIGFTFEVAVIGALALAFGSEAVTPYPALQDGDELDALVDTNVGHVYIESTVQLSPDMEHKLLSAAMRRGQDVISYWANPKWETRLVNEKLRRDKFKRFAPSKPNVLFIANLDQRPSRQQAVRQLVDYFSKGSSKAACWSAVVYFHGYEVHELVQNSNAASTSALNEDVLGKMRQAALLVFPQKEAS